MTYKEIIELSLKVWKWLRDHPDKRKEDSPYYEQIAGMFGECPLCAHVRCRRCVLNLNRNICCTDDRHPYYRWSLYSIESVREKAAGEIVDILQAEYERIENGKN